MKKFIIGLLVNNEAGVLTRISSMFARIGFNIDSLAVGETENPELSRITVTMTGEDYARDQMVKQLQKLYDVRELLEMDPEESVSRELAIIKVAANRESRQDVIDAAQIFRNKIIDYSPESVSIEVTGETGKIDAFVKLMEPYGILEICRTGLISMSRGTKTLKENL